jgi:hypothetical protein
VRLEIETLVCVDERLENAATSDFRAGVVGSQCRVQELRIGDLGLDEGRETLWIAFRLTARRRHPEGGLQQKCEQRERHENEQTPGVHGQ